MCEKDSNGYTDWMNRYFPESIASSRSNIMEVLVLLERLEGVVMKLPKGDYSNFRLAFNDYFKQNERKIKNDNDAFVTVLAQFVDKYHTVERLNIALKKIRQNEEDRIKKYAEKQRRKEELTLAKQKARKQKIAKEQEFNILQKKQFDLVNKSGAFLWESRQTAVNQMSRGDQICSYTGNKFGFIEEIAEDNIKVLWKGKIANQLSGFYFGNMPKSAMSGSRLGIYQYSFDKLSEVSWVSKDKIASCNHPE